MEGRIMQAQMLLVGHDFALHDFAKIDCDTSMPASDGAYP
jgi:hypothetical protein